MKRVLCALMLFLAGLLAGRELEIRCTTDLHGRLSRLPLLVAALEPGRDDLLRVDAGDTIQGTLLSRLDSGRSMIDALGMLRYDVWVPGNHDFEFGAATLAARCRQFPGTVLGADWECTGFRPVPWKLFLRNGVRCAVIGLTEPGMARRVVPGTEFSFHDPVETLRCLMPEIRRAEADAVILVWHCGLYSKLGSLRSILRQFPEIDLVIGGHSHEEHAGESAGRVYFLQAGKFAEAVGAVRLSVHDRFRRVMRMESSLLRPAVLSAGSPPLPELAELVTKTETAYRLFASRPLFGGIAPAEAVRQAARCDAALVARRPPIGNPLTPEELFRQIPYENRVYVVTLRRAELLLLLREETEAVKRWGTVLDGAGIKWATDRRGRPVSVFSHDPCRVAVSEYWLTGSKTLRPLLAEPVPRWRFAGFCERDAWENALRLKP